MMTPNYVIYEISIAPDSNSESGPVVSIDYKNLENGSIYRMICELGMKVHLDFKYQPETMSTKGTALEATLMPLP